jgi:glucose/arabinose dehydrogenase
MRRLGSWLPASTLAAVAAAMAACSRLAVGKGPPAIEKIRLPPGFRIAVFSAAVPGARSLALGERGTLFVGTQKGQVYAVVDANRDGVADRVVTIATGLDVPNGVAVHGGALYVAEVGRILRYDAIEDHLQPAPAPAVVTEALPKDHHHGWKFIAFGPDGLLYVPVGAPCNVCEPSDPRYATILRFRPDGTPVDTMARGVRNTVGFDWEPSTGVLWFTDNGRDLLGDDVPPDELDRAPRPGLHFGFPHCHGGTIPDPVFQEGRACSEFEPPAMKLGPHVAAIGMRFYRGTMFPAPYRGQIFIAEHGSWNRSRKVGYRVTLAKVKDGAGVAYEAFAEGWRQGERAWGRPADVQELPDGSLLVSDDLAGAVYRITYAPP